MDSFYIVSDGITPTIIIEKHWNFHVTRLQKNTIRSQIIHKYWKFRHEPLKHILNTSILNVHHNSLYYILTTQNDVDLIVSLYQLSKLVELFVDYFGELNDSVIKANFTTVYQIVEEFWNDGELYCAERALIEQLVPKPIFLSNLLTNLSLASLNNAGTASRPNNSNSKVSWRQNGIKYAHNEIFFDITEDITAIVNLSKSELVHSNVSGSIECLSRLSGYPSLILNLKNASGVNVGFNSICTWKSKGKSLSFIPMDGSFQLLEYSCNFKYQEIPLTLKPIVQSVGDNLVKIQLTLKPKQSMQDVTLKTHLPFCQLLVSSTKIGNAEFNDKSLVWNLGKIEKETMIMATFSTNEVDVYKGSLLEFKLTFKIAMSTISGVQIDGLAVQNENYKPFKGGRSVVNGLNCVYRYQI